MVWELGFQDQKWGYLQFFFSFQKWQHYQKKTKSLNPQHLSLSLSLLLCAKSSQLYRPNKAYILPHEFVKLNIWAFMFFSSLQFFIFTFEDFFIFTFEDPLYEVAFQSFFMFYNLHIARSTYGVQFQFIISQLSVLCHFAVYQASVLLVWINQCRITMFPTVFHSLKRKEKVLTANPGNILLVLVT